MNMLLTIYGVRWTTGDGFGAESRLAHNTALFLGGGYGVIKLCSLPQSSDYPPRVRHEVNKPVVQSGADFPSVGSYTVASQRFCPGNGTRNRSRNRLVPAGFGEKRIDQVSEKLFDGAQAG